MRRVYFITHPDVVIDPAVPVPRWPLSGEGKERMAKLLAQPWIGDIGSIYCSAEQKALDGAEILGRHLSLDYETVEELGENDRSSAGYLPPDEFQATVDSFFSHPDRSIRGWEAACDAQQRIVEAIDTTIGNDENQGDIVIVSHGGVGTLYLCYLKHCSIDRAAGQPGAHGGNYYCFDAGSKALLHGWRRIDP